MITVRTDHPLAGWTVDHQHPRGTRNDSSADAEFNRRLFSLIPAERLRLLDLGCAGGGLVGSLLDDGALAVGVEGSNYSQARGRAEWGRHPGNLFTADITEPFRVLEDGAPLLFDVVTVWEVLEHIPEDRLPAVAANIRGHLVPGGLLIGSVATCGDFFGGVEYHATQRPASWWLRWLDSEGFRLEPDLISHFGPHWVRGPGKGDHSACLVLSKREPG